MTLPNLPEVPPNPSTQQLAQIVGSLVQELTYLLSGFLSSNNAREFGSWQVSNNELQSSKTYPKVVLNGLNNFIAAYQDANNHLDFVPVAGTAPGIMWTAAASTLAYLQANAAFGVLLTTFGAASDITLQSGGDINLSVGTNQLTINGNTGLNLSILTVKDVVAGVPVYGSQTYTKGILTAIT